MKRILALTLCVFMLVSAAAGCGTTAVTPSATAAPAASSAAAVESTAAAATAEATAAAAGTVTEPGTFPVVKDKVTYKAVVATGPFVEDMFTNKFTTFYEEKTNVHIEWQVISEQGAAEKVSIILASGDLPDFFMNASVPDIEVKYGTQEGLIIPVDDLIKNNMIYLQEAMATYPVGSMDTMRQVDGKLYGLPTMTDCFHCANAAKMWINQKWLTKLGLAIPTTTAEFEAVLKAFKEKDPNGNGKQDEIPLVGAIKGGWNNTVDKFLLNSFLYYDMDINPDTDAGTQAGWFLTPDKKVDTALNKDAYKAGLTWLNSLYKQGLLYDGSFTQDATQLTQLIENPDAELVGCVPGGWGGTFAKVPGERYSQYVSIAPLKGPDGQQNAITFPQLPYNTLWITNVAKNPEVIARWADWLYTVEGSLTVRRGFKDVAWRDPKDGEMGINGKPAVWTQLIPWNDSEPQNETWTRLGPFAETDGLRLGQTTDLKLERTSMEGLELFLYEQTAKNYRPYAQFDKVVQPLKFSDATMSELVTMKVEFGKYVKQANVEFITGKKDLAKDWDAYLAGLESVGLPKILEIYNAAYSSIYAAK